MRRLHSFHGTILAIVLGFAVLIAWTYRRDAEAAAACNRAGGVLVKTVMTGAACITATVIP